MDLQHRAHGDTTNAGCCGTGLGGTRGQRGVGLETQPPTRPSPTPACAPSTPRCEPWSHLSQAKPLAAAVSVSQKAGRPLARAEENRLAAGGNNGRGSTRELTKVSFRPYELDPRPRSTATAATTASGDGHADAPEARPNVISYEEDADTNGVTTSCHPEAASPGLRPARSKDWCV